MRICLLTGGGYPYARDALGGWCRTLVGGLTGYTFDLLSLTDREPPARTAYPLGPNVTSAAAVPFTGTPVRRDCRPDDARAAAVLLCRGLLGEERSADEMFAEALRRLAELAGTDEAPLHGVPLADVLLDAVRAGRAAPATDRLPLPRLSLRDARTATTLLRNAVRALAVRAPEVDLLHCVGGTAPLLAALAARWRTGTPLLLTEARPPIGRQRPAEERLPVVVRTVLRRFRRAVARTGYAEAGLIAPLSTYHHGWALRQGAQPAKIVAVPAGVDPRLHPGAGEPAGQPALTWAGGPGTGLGLLLDAMAAVTARIPGTHLYVTTTGDHRQVCEQAVADAGLGRCVHVGPPDTDRRYADGHVVVHLPGASEPPYRLIEAMLSGRPVIGVDTGPVAETLGDAGVLVPADDPAALADACVALLRSPWRRRELADAARRRALAHFTADRVVRCYDALYADLTAPPPAPAYELALAVSAPRTARPTTVRWLAQEER
jgi:glycosyltransferase involved in cell wall biosynthesis